MKFFEIYEDFIYEARLISDEKFDWIIQNLGDWLFEELYSRPQLVNSLPYLEEFKTFIKYKTTEKKDSDEDLVSALYRIDDFLNLMPAKQSQDFIKSVSTTFPKIAFKISRFGKPETLGKRGRPFGAKNKIKKVDYRPEPELDITKGKIEPQTIKPTLSQSEPKKRGRKSLDSPFTAIERHIFKKEGPEKIEKMETRVKELDSQVNQTIQKIQKMIRDIDRRKNFFGLE